MTTLRLVGLRTGHGDFAPRRVEGEGGGALQISVNEATTRENCLPAPGSVERSSSSCFADEQGRPSPLEHERHALRRPNPEYRINYSAGDL